MLPYRNPIKGTGSGAASLSFLSEFLSCSAMGSFGEKVDLTAILQSILERYPLGVGLFREIIQNSDDAKATKQVLYGDNFVT